MSKHTVRARQWDTGWLLSFPEWPTRRLALSKEYQPAGAAREHIARLIDAPADTIEIDLEYL